MKTPVKPHSNDHCSQCDARCKSPFGDVPAHQLKKVDALKSIQLIKEGQRLTFSDDGKDGFYCVFKGHIKIECEHPDGPVAYRICGPGDIVGVEPHQTYLASALEDTQVCFINKKSFQNLQNNAAEISQGVINSLLKSLSESRDHILGLENHNVQNRVASTLLILAQKFGIDDPIGTLIDVKLERKILAQLSGTGVESLARSLTQLEEQKLILRKGRRIYVTNIEQLRASLLR